MCTGAFRPGMAGFSDPPLMKFVSASIGSSKTEPAKNTGRAANDAIGKYQAYRATGSAGSTSDWIIGADSQARSMPAISTCNAEQGTILPSTCMSRARTLEPFAGGHAINLPDHFLAQSGVLSLVQAVDILSASKHRPRTFCRCAPWATSPASLFQGRKCDV